MYTISCHVFWFLKWGVSLENFGYDMKDMTCLKTLHKKKMIFRECSCFIRSCLCVSPFPPHFLSVSNHISVPIGPI